jgi:hypothetical protein
MSKNKKIGITLISVCILAVIGIYVLYQIRWYDPHGHHPLIPISLSIGMSAVLLVIAFLAAIFGGHEMCVKNLDDKPGSKDL